MPTFIQSYDLAFFKGFLRLYLKILYNLKQYFPAFFLTVAMPLLAALALINGYQLKF